MTELPIKHVNNYFSKLQKEICSRLEFLDGGSTFRDDLWSRKDSSGTTSVLANGKVFEQAGVNFSCVSSEKMPQAATARKPELASRPFQAMGVSVVIHPLNPYVPSSHMNVRFFVVDPESKSSIWWFGGGFDLTPCYGFREDAIHWHQLARDACRPFGTDLYPRFKQACDEYFKLDHRGEQRGIGGLFFDDFNEKSFDHAFRLTQSVGDHFLPAYLPLVERRRSVEFGERERKFQLFRRGRYVEFNLVHDRGTRFGLQSGGRTQSILISLPPAATWHYEWPVNDKNTPEVSLKSDFLQPKDWIQDS